MSKRYVAYYVRAGTERGHGTWMGYPFADNGTIKRDAWVTTKAKAWRFDYLSVAEMVAEELEDARVIPVRLVTLSEQLRKANEEIDRLLENGRIEARQGFHEGRQWERERIMEYVQWRSEYRKHWGPVTVHDIEQELHLRQRKPYRDGTP